MSTVEDRFPVLKELIDEMCSQGYRVTKPICSYNPQKQITVLKDYYNRTGFTVEVEIQSFERGDPNWTNKGSKNTFLVEMRFKKYLHFDFGSGVQPYNYYMVGDTVEELKKSLNERIAFIIETCEADYRSDFNELKKYSKLN